MSRAVCLGCGGPKWGALTSCPACERRPESPEEEARAVLASDEHLTEAELDALAADVRAGRPVSVDPEALARLTAEHAAVPHAPVWFALLVGAGPLALLALIAALALAATAWIR